MKDFGGSAVEGKLSLNIAGEADYTVYREEQRLGSQSPSEDLTQFISPPFPRQGTAGIVDHAQFHIVDSYRQLSVGSGSRRMNPPVRGDDDVFNSSAEESSSSTTVASWTIGTRGGWLTPSSSSTSSNVSPSKRPKVEDGDCPRLTDFSGGSNKRQPARGRGRSVLWEEQIESQKSLISPVVGRGISWPHQSLGPSYPGMNTMTRLPGIGIPFMNGHCSPHSPQKPVGQPPSHWKQGLALREDMDSNGWMERNSEKFTECMKRRYKSTFVDTHCHLDFLFSRNCSAYRGHEFERFKTDNYRTWPPSYEACITDFCDPDLYWDDSENAFWCSMLKVRHS